MPNYAAGVPISVTTAAPDTTPPGPVTNVAATPTTTTEALTWTNPTDADYAGVMIRRAAGGTAPSSATAGTLVTDTTATATSFTDTGLTPSTQYSYAFFAHDAIPNYAAGVDLTNTTLAPPDTTPPGVVTGLSATPTTTTVALSWTNPTDADYAGVMIRRAIGSTPPNSTTSGTFVANITTPGATFTDTALSPTTQYSYALFTYDGVPNYSAGTGVTTTTLTPPDTTPPGPVTAVSATPGNTSVALSWTRPGDSDYTGVMIRRAVGATAPSSPTAGTLVSDVASPTSTITDSGLASGTQYSYAFFAHDAVPNYATGVDVTTTTTVPPDTTPPGNVTGLTATPSTTSVALSWTNPGDSDYAGVMIRRATGSTPPSSITSGQLVAKVTTPGTTYTDSGLASGTQYAYALFAYDGVPNYASGDDIEVATTVPPDTTPPGNVTGLTATPSTTSVALSWTDPGDSDYAGVMIRRTTGSTPPSSITDGQLVTDVTTPGTTYTDSGLSSGTQYSYALFAYDGVPNYASGTDVTTTTTTPPDTTPPGPVSALTATPTSDSVALSWTNPGDSDYTGVTIRRATGDTPPTTPTDGDPVTDVAAPGTTYTDSGLDAGTDYSYSFFAHDGSGNYSAPDSIMVTTDP